MRRRDVLAGGLTAALLPATAGAVTARSWDPLAGAQALVNFMTSLNHQFEGIVAEEERGQLRTQLHAISDNLSKLEFDSQDLIGRIPASPPTAQQTQDLRTSIDEQQKHVHGLHDKVRQLATDLRLADTNQDLAGTLSDGLREKGDTLSFLSQALDGAAAHAGWRPQQVIARLRSGVTSIRAVDHAIVQLLARLDSPSPTAAGHAG
jgi:hypothetical protein